MKKMMSRSVNMLLAASALGLAAPALANNVPTPRSVLGFDVGDDYKLANYDEAVRYFQALARSSDRIKLVETGKSTHGKTLIYAVISSPQNLANFEKYKDISRRLGDPRTLSEADARQLAKNTPIIVHIDGGMHSSEVADHQLPLALAHKLLSAENDAEVDAILKDVVLVLWPTLNPDGQNMVVDWYRKQRGTKWETSRTPWLYQEYVGHDNNRDGYMLNMKESQVVNATEQDYAPVIWYSQHQVAPFPARIWVPPFADPVSSNISPQMRIWTNAIGTNIMARMEAEGKSGAIAQARFDNWFPGFLDYIHVFRNTISFFTEVAHDSATPATWEVKDFPKPMQDLKAQIMYPNPWRGGTWRLKDSVDYMVTSSMSVLETAQKYRETLLFNRYQAGRDIIAAAAKDGPAAYVIPAGQVDMPTAAALSQVMVSHGLDVLQLPQPAVIGGKNYPAGSWVIPMDQPFAGLARELFEAQSYPDSILNGDGQPASLPYDVTGWTLPMQMNVQVDRISQPLDVSIRSTMQKVAAATPPSGGVSGTGNSYLIDRRVNNSYKVLNAALAAGGKATWTNDAIAITGISSSAVNKLATDYSVSVTASTEATAGDPVGKARVALYRPWGSNMDEGWTRWLLEQYAFSPKTVHNADVKAGLTGKFDTIVIPDMNAPSKTRPGDMSPSANFESQYSGPLASLMDGFSPNQMPAPYSGGIGAEGAAKLKAFVQNGGTLVALNNASDAIIDLFDLPVTNILKNVKSDQFFCSGALLQIEMAPDTTISAGLPASPIVMFERGPAFSPKPGFQGKILASYAPTGNPLRSGVLLHPEAIQGKAAAVEVQYGKGKVYLYGFRPQWRGQSHGAYKLFFNALYPQASK